MALFSALPGDNLLLIFKFGEFLALSFLIFLESILDALAREDVIWAIFIDHYILSLEHSPDLDIVGISTMTRLLDLTVQQTQSSGLCSKTNVRYLLCSDIYAH